MMNDFLAQHFLTTSYGSDLSQLEVPSNEDEIISYLNEKVGKWTFEVADVCVINETKQIVTVNVYFPQRILSGTGINYHNAICNVLRDILCGTSQSTNSVPQQSPPQKNNNVVNNLLGELEKKKEAVQQKTSVSTPKKVEDNTIDFFSPEAEELSKQVVQELQEESQQPKKLSPEVVNPTNALFGKGSWTQEQTNKAMEWMSEFGVNKEEEFSAWLNNYCGLDYNHFNPNYIDSFIEYTKLLRDKQTY